MEGRWAVYRETLLRQLPARVARRFAAERGSGLAVLIAWNAMFAALPIVVLIAAILGLLLRLSHLGSGDYEREMLVILPGMTKTDFTDPLRADSGRLLLLAAVGLSWSGAALFTAMETAFAAIYRTGHRPFLRQKLMALGMMLLFTVLTGVLIGTASILPALQHLSFLPAVARSGLGLAGQVALGVLDGTVLYLAIYHFVPNRALRFRQVWPGAVAAGVALEAITLLFPTYLALNRGLDRFGQTFGLIFVLLTFFYLLGLVTVLGALVNAEMPDG